MNVFDLNNHTWMIDIVEDDKLLKEYQERVPDAYSCFGLTFYKKHLIWISEDLCPEEKMRTLKHELVHAYIWEMGFYNADFNNEEMICDFVAAIYDFINEVLEKVSFSHECI